MKKNSFIVFIVFTLMFSSCASNNLKDEMVTVTFTTTVTNESDKERSILLFKWKGDKAIPFYEFAIPPKSEGTYSYTFTKKKNEPIDAGALFYPDLHFAAGGDWTKVVIDKEGYAYHNIMYQWSKTACPIIKFPGTYKNYLKKKKKDPYWKW